MNKAPDLTSVRIVLVEPGGAFNIGSVARAMKNMGFSDLGLVNPAEYRTDEAFRGAVGARDVLESAGVFGSIGEAVRDAALVVGTTRRTGSSRPASCTLEELPARLLPVTFEGRAAILFGREQSGLKTSETDLCNLLVRIPSSSTFPSLNLSHAVLLVCYRLFTASAGEHLLSVAGPASNERVEELIAYIHDAFSEIGFFSKGSSGYVVNLFRRVFGRALLNEEEVEHLGHIFSRLRGLCVKHGTGRTG
jgi:tRNA/rRNA methyltransferase